MKGNIEMINLTSIFYKKIFMKMIKTLKIEAKKIDC